MKFTENRLNPSDFDKAIGKSSVFKIGARVRNNLLLGRRPRDKIGAKKDIITASTSTIIKAKSPISISIACNVVIK